MKKATTAVGRKARHRAAETLRLMKECGKYSEAYLMQVDLLSRTLAELDDIEREKSRREYRMVINMISREGNDRPVLNPLEQLYGEFLDRAQRCLKALGMNTDSKERKGEEAAGLEEFLREMKEL